MLQEPPFSKCLGRALVIAALLTKLGYKFILNVCLEENNALKGHAWIEINGSDKIIDLHIEKIKVLKDLSIEKIYFIVYTM